MFQGKAVAAGAGVAVRSFVGFGGFVGGSVGACVGGSVAVGGIDVGGIDVVGTFVGGKLVGFGCGVLVGGICDGFRSGLLVKVTNGCVAEAVAVKVEVALGVSVSSRVAVGFAVCEGCKEAVIVDEAVGLKNICANASLVSTCAVLSVALGVIFPSKRSPACVSRILPPERMIGMPKLTPAMNKMTTNSTMLLRFILQAFPVCSSDKSFRVAALKL
jgi:hypothetical protein